MIFLSLHLPLKRPAHLSSYICAGLLPGGRNKKEILDSIYYARRIQRTLLPSEKYIQKNLRKAPEL
jgi:hypothetical protein